MPTGIFSRNERGPIRCKIVLPTEEVFEGELQLRSEIGACVKVSQTFKIPDQFRLSIGPLAEQCDVQVAWRQPSELGVLFVDKAAI